MGAEPILFVCTQSKLNAHTVTRSARLHLRLQVSKAKHACRLNVD